MLNLRIPMYIFILWQLAFVSASPIDPGDDPGHFLKDSLAAAEGKKLVSFGLKRFHDQNVLIKLYISRYYYSIYTLTLINFLYPEKSSNQKLMRRKLIKKKEC